MALLWLLVVGLALLTPALLNGTALGPYDYLTFVGLGHVARGNRPQRRRQRPSSTVLAVDDAGMEPGSPGSPAALEPLQPPGAATRLQLAVGAI